MSFEGDRGRTSVTFSDRGRASVTSLTRKGTDLCHILDCYSGRGYNKSQGGS